MNKKIILKAINNAIGKCDYPKAIALREFDEKNYVTETYSSNEDSHGKSSPIGKLQQEQEDLQASIDYDGLDRAVLGDYGLSSFIPINKYLNQAEGWENEVYYTDENGDYDPEYDEKTRTLNVRYSDNSDDYDMEYLSVFEEISALNNVIDKSPRLKQDTVLYRYGHFEEGGTPNQHGVLKGFSSATYNEYVASDSIRKYPFAKSENRYMMKIYAPKGTKGVVLDNNLTGRDFQSEFLIGRNQRYIILNQDDSNKTVEILLY